MLKKIVAALFLVFCARTAFAACGGSSPSWTAASASQADVAACVTAASSGDTINVPADTKTWLSAVTIASKKIKLVGAGIGSTNITIGFSGVGLNVTGVSATNFSDISGFTFIKGTGSTQSDGMLYITCPTPGAQNAFRVHNNRFLISTTGSGATRGMTVEACYGLIDNNTFDDSSGVGYQMIQVLGSNDSNDGGWTPWTTFALTLGTVNAVYIEANTITMSTSGADPQTETVIDQYGGSKTVFRFNTVKHGDTGGHGTDSGNRRGPISLESYNNAFTNDGAASERADTLRGGTAMYFSNTFGGTKSWNGFTIMAFRASNGTSSDYSWQLCDGTSWEVGSNVFSSGASRQTVTSGGYRFLSSNKETLCNSGGTCTVYFDGAGTRGYPCRDQPGWSIGQVITPIYAWLNTSGITVAPYDGGSCQACGGQPISNWMAANREYYNYTASFTGATGVGVGTRGSRPASTTTGVAYWSTDQGGNWDTTNGAANDGCLDKVVAGAWSDCYYTPYTYPHPLQDCAAADHVSFTTQPSNTVLGGSLGTVIVTVQDAVGVTCSTATNTITLAKNGSATWGTLNSASNLAKAAVAGLATWTDLSITVTAGSGSIDASASGGLTGTSSASVTISAPAASAIVVIGSPAPGARSAPPTGVTGGGGGVRNGGLGAGTGTGGGLPGRR